MLSELLIEDNHLPSNEIVCGNAVEIMKQMPENSIDLTVTSPPYDELRHYKGYHFDYKAIAKGLYRVTKKGGVVVWVVGDKLSIKDSKGLVLLHGKPGTGKTTYIRYLVSTLAGKKIIFIPPGMIQSLASPDFIPFILDKPNSILVCEDAENALMSRKGTSNQSVSNILIISDGILSDCMHIQIIATFNTDIMNIDTALLRKGRLIAKYEFKELESERAQKLADKLGVSINGEHALTDIYNGHEAAFTSEKTKIGY